MEGKLFLTLFVALSTLFFDGEGLKVRAGTVDFIGVEVFLRRRGMNVGRLNQNVGRGGLDGGETVLFRGVDGGTVNP